MFAHRRERGDELLLVVGRLGDARPDDQARVGFHAGLRVVALLEAVLGLHDAALGVGEVDLVLLLRRAIRRLRLGAAGLPAGLARGFAFWRV